MEAQPVAHVRGAARAAARSRALLPEVDRLWGVPQRADAPPRGRHRRAPDDGARHGGAPRTRRCAVRYACLVPRPRQGHDAGRGAAAPHRPRGAQRRAGARDERAAARPTTPAASWPSVVAREHGNVHRSDEFGAAAHRAPARALRRAAPAGPLRRAAARLRMRRARPARPARTRPIRRARACGGAAARRSGRRRRGRRRRRRAARRPGDRRRDPRRARGARDARCSRELQRDGCATMPAKRR